MRLLRKKGQSFAVFKMRERELRCTVATATIGDIFPKAKPKAPGGGYKLKDL
jgi:hypothetical protein